MNLAFNNRVRRRAALAVKTVAVLALAAWRTPFHLHLVKSVPAANATMTSTPESIRLWFSQPPELAVTTVKVTGPGSTDVPLAALAGGDSSLVIAPVKSTMPSGSYTVVWRTMAKDGHVARGTFAFKVNVR